MIRYLTLSEVLALHGNLLASSGGNAGIRDLGRVQAALKKTVATFEGVEVYPSVIEKAAALGCGLIQAQAFADANKRLGHAVTELFLILNGLEIVAPVDEQEKVVLDIASDRLTREGFTDWLKRHARVVKAP